jgi:ABC-type branched-subunit amino acid transport system ATPase component
MRKAFGGVRALNGVDITLRAGRLTAVVGPNGSGKTTLVDCLTGFVRADGGKIVLDGCSLTRASVRSRARAGLHRTFQAAHLFSGLSVRDHFHVAQQEHDDVGWTEQILRLPRLLRLERKYAAGADEMLELVNLSAFADRPADQLSYGQQKLLGLACVLVNEPRVLCLDEPLAGVSPRLVDLLVGVLHEIKLRGISVLLIEHNIDFVHAVSDDVVVMVEGQVLAAGPPELLDDDPRVFEVLMGGD